MQEFDLNERQRVETALRASEAQLRLALDIAEVGTWTWDLASGAGEIDARGAAIVGLRPGTVADIGAAQRERVHPDDLARLEADVRAGVTSNVAFDLAYRVIHSDGSVHHVVSRAYVLADAAGTPLKLIGTNRDVTRQHQTELRLRASEAHNTFLLQLNDRLRLLDSPEQILFAAATLLGELFGVSRVGYAEAQPDGETIVVTRNYTCGVPSIEGRFRYDNFGSELLEALRIGRSVVRSDIVNDPTLSDAEKAAHTRLQLGATVNVPVLTAGRLVGVLFMHQDTARAWTADEVALLEAVTARTWDTLERARAEEALRESEARLQLALDSTGMGTFVWHLADDRAEPDARLLALFGLPPDSTTSPSEALATLLYPEDRASYAAAVQRAINPDGDGRMYAEVRAMQPDGSLRWLAVIGQTFFAGTPPQAVRMAGVIANITERKQVEARLAATAARDQYLVRLTDTLRPLLNALEIEAAATRVLGEQLGATRVAYFEVDGEDYVANHYYSLGVASPAGRFSSASFGPEQLATYQAGRTVVELDVAANPALTPAERETYMAYQIAAHVGVPLVKNGRFVAGLAVHQTTPRNWTVDEVALIEETAERTWSAIERARAEERLQTLYAKEQAARKAAEEASRLKDEFLATVSHELRTPLTAFLGYAGLLQRRERDEAYVRRTVGKMVQSAQAQAALVEDLLDVSRIISGKLRIEPEPIELINVIHAALDTVRPSLEAKHIHVDLTLDPAASAALGDANRLQQVVWNLLSNAAKFSEPSGQVTIGLVPDADEAVITVRDAGQGIDPAFLPYVFDRFRQADGSSQRAHGGLGLGLAIVRHLVELHGGTVAVASAGLNRGATFTVRLPLNRQRAPVKQPGMGPSNAQPVEPLPLPGLRGLRVLVVDDQPNIGELLEELLVAEGATVRVCETSPEGVAMLQTWRPDVLISDIAMPCKDGYWLIEQVRLLPPEAGGATPVVALTAYVRTEDRLRVLQAGFQQYVTKPIDAAELRDVLLHLVAEAREQ